MENGELKDLIVSQHNVAEDIIESFMVAANVAMAQYLKEKRSLSIRRVVRTPKRWDRIRAIAAQFGARFPRSRSARPVRIPGPAQSCRSRPISPTFPCR